jgi:hypothetical protein
MPDKVEVDCAKEVNANTARMAKSHMVLQVPFIRVHFLLFFNLVFCTSKCVFIVKLRTANATIGEKVPMNASPSANHSLVLFSRAAPAPEAGPRLPEQDLEVASLFRASPGLHLFAVPEKARGAS